ncbi:NUDIX hydrolase [Myroides pelagicus]|uniref:8-oxo-dGTP diphosphatase n=1 Tax=Myroides pelagicus TaxID=270914 RepID=A0A7K1GQQ9_9FLAO|nr:NUDIX domain-containing protein [Myroides pelagicus]MEC4115280.1 NUDIX domain-containing protein [Myroides pelagicus]MTH31068.1 NUDIX domain-containing protein [Myroides pelagicus]
MTLKTIHLASALVINSDNEMLVVRKKGSTYYMMAGGKIQTNESAKEALFREIKEELDLDLNNEQISYLGSHQTTAVNEAKTLVSADIFLIRLTTKSVKPHAELEEVIWLNQMNYTSYQLAHLLKEFSLPRWLKMKKEE